MHPNFGLPVVPGASNNPFCPQSPNNFNPNVNPSMPMFQQTPNHLNSPHVFPSNSGFSGHPPSPFIPDLHVIKSFPPPSFMPPAPPTLPGNHIPKIPAPQWNSPQMPGQFQAIPSTAPPYPPSIFPSNKYNNMNVAYSSSNGFNGQQNSIHQTTNAFQRNPAPPFTSVSSNSSVQPISNSFQFSTNGASANPNNGNAAFSYGRNSSDFNRDNKRFKGSNSTQFDSKEMPWASGFGAYANIPPNRNEQVGPKSPFMMELNNKTPHNANNFHHNRGRKRPYVSDRSYPNFHSTNQGNGYKNGNVNNAFGETNMKSDRNSGVPKPYSCDTCDRAFASEAELKFHLSEHVKCDSGNCQFEAHPKIVALHKKMQHDTGYADAISKLKNDDEIEKWRAERRRRFPTLENIEKRKAEQAEKEARGEVIENKEFGKFKGRNSQQNGPRHNDHMNGRKRRRGAPKIRNALSATQYPHSVAKRTASVSDSESDSDDDSHIKLPKFKGMLASDLSEKEDLESHPQKLLPDSPEPSDNIPQKRTAEPPPIDDSESVDPVEENTSSLEQRIEGVDTDTADQVPSFSPIELDMERDETGNQSIEIEDDMSTENVPISLIELDDDEPPIEIPIIKEKDYLPQMIPTIDVENDDEAPTEIPITKSVRSITGSDKRDGLPQRMPMIDVENDDEAPTEIPITRSAHSMSGSAERDLSDGSPVDHQTERNLPENQGVRREARNCDRNSRGAVHRDFNGRREYPELPRKSSLLEKLLADDIRHERNVIMQCIRHIVKKNFFDINVNK